MSDHHEGAEEREMLDELRLRHELEKQLIALLASESFEELERLGDDTGLTAIDMKNCLGDVRIRNYSLPVSANPIRSRRGKILQHRREGPRIYLTELKLVEPGGGEVFIEWCYHVSKAGEKVMNVVSVKTARNNDA